MAKILHTRSAGGFILNSSKQLLMVQEYGYYWGLPRGHIESGESAEEAAIREIGEETGLTNLVMRSKLGSYTRSTFDRDGKPNYKEIKHITFFYFTTHDNSCESSDPAITAIKWYDIGVARTLLINNEDLSFFDKAIEIIKSNNI